MLPAVANEAKFELGAFDDAVLLFIDDSSLLVAFIDWHDVVLPHRTGCCADKGVERTGGCDKEVERVEGWCFDASPSSDE